MGVLAIKGGKPVRARPFPSWPVFGEEERKEVLEVLESGKWTIGSEKISLFEREFARFQHAKYGVACCNGTTALVIALKALGVGRGDYVLVPAYTFLATATAVIDVGATPVFVDVEEDTLTISVEDAEERIVEGRTKCIIPVHIAGLPANMDKVMEFAEKHGLRVLEDSAQAHGAEWRERRVGSIGDAGTFSFYQSKNMTSGEGGFVTTNEEEIAELLWSYHNVGRDRRRAWYEHVRYGWNFRMTSFQAAILLAQLKRLPSLMKKREKSAKYLDKQLSSIEHVTPLHRPSEVTSHAYHLYIFKISSEVTEKVGKHRIVEALRAEGIPCSPGYNPVYSYGFLWENMRESPQSRGGLKLANTENACKEAIWLPQNVLLAEREDLDDVVRAVEKVLENLEELA